jgi:hypothetical protein
MLLKGQIAAKLTSSAFEMEKMSLKMKKHKQEMKLKNILIADIYVNRMLAGGYLVLIYIATIQLLKDFLYIYQMKITFCII